MVDRSELPEVNNLDREFSQLEQAIHNLDNGGHVASMVIVGQTPDEPSAIVTLDLSSLVAEVRALCQKKEQEVIDNMAEYGITGLKVTPRAEPPKSRKK